MMSFASRPRCVADESTVSTRRILDPNCDVLLSQKLLGNRGRDVDFEQPVSGNGNRSKGAAMGATAPAAPGEANVRNESRHDKARFARTELLRPESSCSSASGSSSDSDSPLAHAGGCRPELLSNDASRPREKMPGSHKEVTVGHSSSQPFTQGSRGHHQREFSFEAGDDKSQTRAPSSAMEDSIEREREQPKRVPETAAALWTNRAHGDPFGSTPDQLGRGRNIAVRDGFGRNSGATGSRASSGLGRLVGPQDDARIAAARAVAKVNHNYGGGANGEKGRAGSKAGDG
jgi:hypothetical protein